MAYKLMDSKVGERAAFEGIEEAREALADWIQKQRAAGEAVAEQPTGQWTDSRVTIWVCDADENIVKIV